MNLGHELLYRRRLLGQSRLLIGTLQRGQPSGAAAALTQQVNKGSRNVSDERFRIRLQIVRVKIGVLPLPLGQYFGQLITLVHIHVNSPQHLTQPGGCFGKGLCARMSTCGRRGKRGADEMIRIPKDQLPSSARQQSWF